MADHDRPQRHENLAVPDRMALLHTLTFTALRLSAAQLDGFTTRLCEALASPGSDAAPDIAPDAGLYRHAAEHLARQRMTFHRLFTESLQECLLQAVQVAGMQGALRLESGAMDLSLIDFAAMERKVLIDNLSQAIDAVNADVLAVLGMRIAHWLQPEETGIPAHTGANPFRAETFVTAFAKAWGKFDLNSATQHVMLQQLHPEIFLQCGPILQVLSQELAIRNILPDAEQEYRRRCTAHALPAPSRQEKLRRWLAPDGMLNVIDARAAGLMDKAFDRLGHDESIPPAIRELIDRLRAPLRNLALADIEFFFRATHPARSLVDAVLAAGLACDPAKGRNDPLHVSIAQVLDRLEETPKAGAFEQAIRVLQALAAQREDAFTARLGETAAEAASQENISHAMDLAQDDVHARIESGEVPGFVEAFLQAQWSRVLVFAYGTRDSKPELLAKVLQAMDELIWSVQPKGSEAERKALVERLPALLSMLNAWLNVVKWDGTERESFFATLAERHQAAIRALPELTPRHQLELRMNMMQKASEHQLSRRAQQQQEEVLAEFMRQADTLVPGNWLTFVRNDGSKMNCRLMWVSPGRSRFIFAGRQGQLVFTLTDESLAQAMRAGRTSIIASSDTLARALDAALTEIVGD
ncbi:MAG TPA: DUF1631 family protein [Noviherbaspirillum sp.]|uniref:DUF1631 family protein n=1 Tax=Noviherbaspirillum sp. TaxID=1926288 RepID=UPI002B485A3B|nr:DUF1631 family protein [Noviherbaspirillum sp.]HJV84365.1 DUF1631 family protein [Noviherbaspirillum sp.]